MTLSAWEQQALDTIQDGLTGSDPRLAGLLAMFTRLVSDEEMPVREKIRIRSRRNLCHSSRGRCRGQNQSRRRTPLVRPHLGFQQAALLVYMAIAVVLIVTVLILNHGVSQDTCPSNWGIQCVSSAHMHTPNSSTHKRVDSHTRVPGRPHQAPG
jgi:hypothetical protein